MGLDMYARYQPKRKKPVDFNNPGNTEESKEFFYWRKHNALHAAFEEIFKKMPYEEYVANGGLELGQIKDEKGFNSAKEVDFNCIIVPLSNEILNELEDKIVNGGLKPTSGFFFGSTDYDPKEEEAEDLKFITIARNFLEYENIVYYDSWW